MTSTIGNADWWFQFLQAVGALATAIGVGIAVYQLNVQKTQQMTDFEDRLTEQYRAIIAKLPLEVLLEDEAFDLTTSRRTLHVFYQYFDLTNEQIFQHEAGRISQATWKNWEDGIRGHMNRRAFGQAWSTIAAAVPESFDELRKLVRPEGFHLARAAGTPLLEPSARSAEVVMPDDAAGRVLAIRKATNSSWSNLRKAVAALAGDQQVKFGTPNVENTSKSIVRRMLRETSLSLDELSRVLEQFASDRGLDSTDDERREPRVEVHE